MTSIDFGIDTHPCKLLRMRVSCFTAGKAEKQGPFSRRQKRFAILSLLNDKELILHAAQHHDPQNAAAVYPMSIMTKRPMPLPHVAPPRAACAGGDGNLGKLVS